MSRWITFAFLSTTLALNAQTITVRSGNGSIGGTDASIHFLLGPATGDFGHVFTASDFSNAQTGPAAFIVTPNPLWVPSLTADSSAKWIGSNADAGLGNGNTALYAVSFTVPAAFSSATLVLNYAADDGIGETAGGGTNINTGVYLNGAATCGSSFVVGFGQASVANCGDVTSSLLVGTNWFFIEDGNAAGPAGLLFSATLTTTASGTINPPPVIASLSPTSAPAGSSSLTLTINGTGFLTNSSVTFNGTSHGAVVQSASQLTITLTTSDLATAGTFPVVVTNPPPGGGSSQPFNFAVTNPQPTITGLSPSSAQVGSSPLTLTIFGTGFLIDLRSLSPDSLVTFNGISHAASFKSASQLTITLTASDLDTAGSFLVVVTNPTPGGGSSQPVNFTVSAAPNPVPSITGLSPVSAPAGSSPLSLTISGTGFLPTSSVTFNGIFHAVSFQSVFQLTITLTASDLATAGTFSVVVTNPSPGGGSSQPVNFTITPAVPSINVGGVVNSADFSGPVSPGSIASVFGTFPVSSSSPATVTPLPTTLSGLSMHFSGIAVPLLYASPGQANVQIPWELTGQTQTLATATVNSQTSAPQTIQLAAFSPGIFTMNAQGQGAITDPSYRIVDSSNPAVPGSTYIEIFCTGLGPVTNQPASGAAAPVSPLAVTTTTTTLTVGGVSATVSFSGLSPTAVGLYQVNAQVPNGVPSGNAVPVVLKIGGTASNTVTIAVQAVQPPNPQPTITGLSPSSVAAGSTAVVLTINGTGLISASAVTFNGVAHAATLANSSQLTITLSASDLSAAGTFAVVVTNPSPGGGASQPLNFTVSVPSNPQPAITSLSPSSAQPGSNPLTLTINGTGFLNTSSVTFNGISHPVSFISTSQLTLTLTASDLAAAGTFAVVVSNPPPGGGNSPSVTFTVKALSQTLTFNVGSAPVALAFDGMNIWVANSAGNTVTKIRASDGSTVGTFSAGVSPNALVFDGSSIWVANAGTSFVTKLRASDGALEATVFAVASSASALAFDGSNIWVTDSGPGLVSSFVSKLRASDGTLLGSFPVGVKPFAATFDGANIWVANSVSNTLTKLQASDGTVMGTFAAGFFPSALLFDGSNIWVANLLPNGKLTMLRPSDGTVLGTFTVGSNPEGLAFDGANIWVANYGSNTVMKVKALTGTVVATFPVQIQPASILFDGTNIWVANSGSNTVTEVTNQSPN